MVKIRIPATSANLGVLFDKGGVALTAFENTITLNKSDIFKISSTGLGTGKLPQNKNNLIYKAIEYFYRQSGIEIPVFSIETNNCIPLSRGLGSSAACIAGGIFAANCFEKSILGEKEIIMMAAELEGHGDNVCAAVTGGFSLFNKNDFRKIQSDPGPGFILYIPNESLSTKKSREVLPSQYDKATLIRAKELEEAMVKALDENDYEKAGSLMSLDVIHQPYRKKMIPFWDDINDTAKKAGVWGTALSGAGSSMISMCSMAETENIIEYMKNHVDKKFNLNIMGCETDHKGIKCIKG